MSLPKPYYEKNGITLYHGDCRDILPHLPKVDAVVADPPYGIGYTPQKHNSSKSAGDRTFCATDKLFGDTGALDFDASDIYDRFKSAHQIWWGANNYADSLPRSRGWLVWYKADGMEKTDFGHAEPAWTSIDQPIRGKNYLWMGMCKAGEREQAVHPTQKPIAVMLWCMSFLPDFGVTLDPFAGSGTTLVAALQLGRKAIGVEIEEAYCKIAVERLEAAARGQSLKEYKSGQGILQF